ncbi:hypothetical protein Psesu_2609 [Pseudoxanthomonas suwonensis 11-1]|uniref:PD-(D/E)XK nuclease superfamily protein n=2 Tax=Pseudoxanthomonas suwonensis TaxID=314722 RepID=E6WWG4_PSEUU|nr:hypothetical protein Psesu_2609 [Pseudoxanthomonas suwonensis 11-1]
MGIHTTRDFERLMADPRLAELNELQRGASDAFDLIELSENQNSNILAWLFDSREGHGQGDEILRDLLLYASKRAMTIEPTKSRWLGQTQPSTRRFFERWTPSRIRTTSFCGAFAVREFGFDRQGRSDLAIIDEHNQLIVVIENKTKTKHTEAQLNRYQKAFEDAIEKNRRLSKFVIAFIAMSEDFDYDEEGKQPCADTWLHVGYGWLKASADRAVRQVERGNASAQLVASYCTERTQWEDPLDRKRTLIAAALLRDYPEAIRELHRFVGPRMTAAWFEHEEQPSSAMLFILQNRGTAKLLSELERPEAIAIQIMALLELESDDGVESRRSGISIRAPHVEHLSRDNWWVSYFNIEHSRAPDETTNEVRYRVTLVLKPEKFHNKTDAAHFRAKYAMINSAFGSNSDRTRTVQLGDGLTQSEALDLLQRTYRKLSAA